MVNFLMNFSSPPFLLTAKTVLGMKDVSVKNKEAGMGLKSERQATKRIYGEQSEKIGPS